MKIKGGTIYLILFLEDGLLPGNLFGAYINQQGVCVPHLTLTNWFFKVPCVRKISPQQKLGSV